MSFRSPMAYFTQNFSTNSGIVFHYCDDLMKVRFLVKMVSTVDVTDSSDISWVLGALVKHRFFYFKPVMEKSVYPLTRGTKGVIPGQRPA